MSVKDHTATDCCKRSSREGCAGAVVGSLHEEASDSSRMENDKSNRGGEERKGIDSGMRNEQGLTNETSDQWHSRMSPIEFGFRRTCVLKVCPLPGRRVHVHPPEREHFSAPDSGTGGKCAWSVSRMPPSRSYVVGCTGLSDAACSGPAWPP